MHCLFDLVRGVELDCVLCTVCLIRFMVLSWMVCCALL